MADFLGDPNFPEKAMHTQSRALKVSWFQELYKQYSRLDFTRYEDRPVAIAGLEKRLQRAFRTQGAFGIFDDGSRPNGSLFHRSLLWQRGEEREDEWRLSPIAFPPERRIRVPSWSWMAYKGGIGYADPPFKSATWERNDIVPPWTRCTQQNGAPPEPEDVTEIRATVRSFNTAGYRAGELKLVYDTDRTRGIGDQRARCVVVARSNDTDVVNEKTFYVLLVVAMGEDTYERAGAGFMLGRFIELSTPGTRATIV